LSVESVGDGAADVVVVVDAVEAVVLVFVELDVDPVAVEITLLVVSSIAAGVAPAKVAPRTRRNATARTIVVRRAQPCVLRQAPNRLRFLFQAAIFVPLSRPQN
jgi:hypothetical protein